MEAAVINYLCICGISVWTKPTPTLLDSLVAEKRSLGNGRTLGSIAIGLRSWKPCLGDGFVMRYPRQGEGRVFVVRRIVRTGYLYAVAPDVTGGRSGIYSRGTTPSRD